jgi:hypothetical protein
VKLQEVQREMSSQMWLRFYYMVGMIRHITTVYNAKKDKEALKAKIKWATMFIAKRIR